MSRPWYREYFPASRPRDAKGGIKAQNKRGQFGESWWAQRWVSVLDSFKIGARLKRGQAYARRGQVLSIDVAKGKVTARVNAAGTVQRVDPRESLVGPRLGEAGENACRPGSFYCQAFGRRDAPGYRKGLPIGRTFAVPAKTRRSGNVVLVPRLVKSVQTRRGGVFSYRRRIRPRPFPYAAASRLESRWLFAKLNRHVPRARAPIDDQATEEAARTEPLPTDSAQVLVANTLPEDLFGDVARPPVKAAWPKRLGAFHSGAATKSFSMPWNRSTTKPGGAAWRSSRVPGYAVRQRAAGFGRVVMWARRHKAGGSLFRSYTRSYIVAIPCPAPMHMVARPNLAPLSIIVWISVVEMRAPLAPSGWPMAMAPPRTLTLFMSAFNNLMTLNVCAAKASLISIRSMSASLRPARSRAL